MKRTTPSHLEQHGSLQGSCFELPCLVKEGSAELHAWRKGLGEKGMGISRADLTPP